MEKTKITKREKFEGIIATLEGKECEISIDELKEFCAVEIETLDRRTAKARERAEEKKNQVDELVEAVYRVLTTELQTIDSITKALDDEDISSQKVVYRLKKLVDEGKAEKGEVTITNSQTNKKRKVSGYKLV